MNTLFKLCLKLKSGLLSELQSDTIFGHFCWRLKDKLGEAKLLEFLELYINGNPIFSLSDGLLTSINDKLESIFFPIPLYQTPYEFSAETKKERIKKFLHYKEFKSKKYITLVQLNHFINNRLNEYNISFEDQYHSNLTYPKFNSSLKAGVRIDRASLAAAEGQLYSVNPDYTGENTQISILIKIFNDKHFEEFKCEEILKDVFVIGYGKKKSTGFGEFELLNYSEYKGIEEPDSSNGFIIMGNYLPSSNDKIKNAYYDTNMKYGRLGEELSKSDNPFKKPILFLIAGSCFFTDSKKDFYGRVTSKGEISDYFLHAIQSGIPFSIRTNLL